MHIKGTFMVEYVKMIRRNKNVDWDKWLTTEDKEILETQVLPSNWYELDSWHRMGAAVFNELAKRNFKVIRSFGPFMIENLLSTYKNVLVPGDPLESIRKFGNLRRNFVKGMEADIIIEDGGAGWVLIKLLVSDRDREIGDPECFAYAVTGSIEGLVKKAGGKNVSFELGEVPEGYDINIKWEM